MGGFQALRPSRPLDVDYGADAATQSGCHKMAKILKPSPLKD